MNEATKLDGHDLDNGLRLEILDDSRRMASDRWRIRLVIRVPIDVAAHYQGPVAEKEPELDALTRTLGSGVVYERIHERVFVEDTLKEDVIRSLTETFLKDVAPYIGGVDFPRKYILKCYRENSA